VVLSNEARVAVLTPPPGGTKRLDADMAMDRQIALVRAFIGVGLLACAAWLFNLPNTLPRLFALAAVAFAALWIVRAAKLVVRTNDPEEKDYLELDHRALKLHERGRDLLLPWAEIANVAIDEDRLTLALLRHTGEIVHIEPRYTGVTLEDLCDAVRALHSEAQSEGASPPPRS
jgi:hypothetical protein